MIIRQRVAKPIDAYSFFYAIYRKYFCLCLRKIYYRKFTVVYDEPIEYNAPIVLASNHQNALIDAINVICSSKGQPVYFARADIFKIKIVIKILRILKIEPIYRIRDGKHTLKQNDEVFEVGQGILERSNMIAIFPEGAHNDREKLMPFKKGLARMVFKAEGENSFNLGIKVVPIGISYKKYFNFGSEIRIHYGKAINVVDYKDVFEQNPAIAYNKLNETITEEIKKRIIHIENDEENFFIQKLRKTFIYKHFNGKFNLDKSFSLSKKLTEKIDAFSSNNLNKYLLLKEHALMYYKLLNESKLKEYILFAERKSFINIILQILFIIIAFPLFLYGIIANYVPFMLPYWFCNKKIKDKQFHSSLSFASSALFIFPLYYIIQSFIVLVVSGNIPLTLIVLLSYIPFGLFAFKYRKVFLSFIQTIRYYFLNKQKQKYYALLSARDLLLNEVEQIYNSID